MSGEILFDILLSLMAIFSTVSTVGVLIICLPHRYSLFVTVAVFAAFTALLLAINYFTGYMARLPISNSWTYLPFVFILFKAPVFQILFSFFSQVFISLALALLLILAFGFLGLYGSVEYFILMLIVISLIFVCYIVLVLRFGKPLLKKLFDGGNKPQWALYSISAFMAHTFLFILWKMHEQNNVLHFGALIFSAWSFFILHYAIINTHDRTKKRLEADYARKIIASGEEHYQKMNEQFETLRIMRHDFKYHQNVLLDFMQTGEAGKAIEYLKGQQAEASQHELMHFCDNRVINALLIWYAGQYEKSGVDYAFKVVLPEKLSVSDYDMCIVIGNLLENALEASLELAGNRKVDLGIVLHNEQLALKISNNFKAFPPGKQKPAMDEAASVLASPPHGRGLGLRSVQIVTDRYGGKLFVKQAEDAFVVTVLMDLASNSKSA